MELRAIEVNRKVPTDMSMTTLCGYRFTLRDHGFGNIKGSLVDIDNWMGTGGQDRLDNWIDEGQFRDHSTVNSWESIYKFCEKERGDRVEQNGRLIGYGVVQTRLIAYPRKLAAARLAQSVLRVMSNPGKIAADTAFRTFINRHAPWHFLRGPLSGVSLLLWEWQTEAMREKWLGEWTGPGMAEGEELLANLFESRFGGFYRELRPRVQLVGILARAYEDVMGRDSSLRERHFDMMRQVMVAVSRKISFSEAFNVLVSRRHSALTDVDVFALHAACPPRIVQIAGKVGRFCPSEWKTAKKNTRIAAEPELIRMLEEIDRDSAFHDSSGSE